MAYPLFPQELQSPQGLCARKRMRFHDIERLLASFNALIDRGHTILIIEHNMEIIKCADHVIDLGPDGGDRGGQLVACGTPEEIASCEQSITGKYLKSLLSRLS